MMAKKSNSDGCGCGKPKCSGCNKYRAGGMLTGGQKRLDKNGNGKIDANDFEMLRKYMSGGMLKDYMSGGMVKKYMDGGQFKGDPKKGSNPSMSPLANQAAEYETPQYGDPRKIDRNLQELTSILQRNS